MPQTTGRHPFDELLDLRDEGDGVSSGRPHPAYANMVGPFGGATAATMLGAVLRHPDRRGDPLALTVNFAGPIADEPFRIQVTPERLNRSTQHWSVRMTQADAVATTATVVTALRRDGYADTELTAPDAPGPDTVAPGGMPEWATWARNYEMRFTHGAPPLTDGVTEHPDSTTTLWVRDIPARPLDFPALASITDVFYPRIYLRRGLRGPAGTVSLTTFFHADSETVASVDTAPVLGTARASSFGQGYFEQNASVWTADRRLLATSHQVVYFKS